MKKDKLLLGTRKGYIILSKEGDAWKATKSGLPGIPVPYAMVDHRSETMWLCTGQGHWGPKLYRSQDGGETIEHIETPTYPEGTTIFDVWAKGSQTPAVTTYLWTIVPGGDDRPGRLYIGTEPGGLFQSDDNGETWQLNRPLWDHPSREKNWFGGGRDQAGCCSIVVDPRDSNHLYAGISVGGVYESHDGGESWHGKNRGLIAEYLPDPKPEYGHDPHYIAASPTNPDVLWMQNHCGVFRTADGADNWADISVPNSGIKFGFPIAVAPNDDQTAWVVPAISDDVRMAIDGALFVARTTDGGQSWKECRNGLPQENCYDVVFRHALDIEAETLAFGTTTGNLFISYDRGDRWESIGNYFPPIYSVRFIE